MAAESLHADRQTDCDENRRLYFGLLFRNRQQKKKYFTDQLVGSWEISRANDSLVLVCVP